MGKPLHADVGDSPEHVPLWPWRWLERLQASRALRAARRAADAELALRHSPPLRLAWRVDELVSTQNRLDLAHLLRSLVRDADARYLPSASPVNRRAVQAAAETIQAAAARLTDLERPVMARGVVLLERLLLDPSGPLYDRALHSELRPSLDRALEALELH